MLDYGALDALAAVVREGSFERAATSLGVTPSAISQRIRGLEERIGAVLVRRGQPCKATPVGARLCTHVEQVHLMERDVKTSLPLLATSDSATRQTIRIALNADSMNSWFAQAAADFARDNDALLDLVLDDEEHTAERLREGDVLAAITADPEPAQGCRSLLLGTMRYVATASPDFMRRHFPEGVTATAIQQAPMIRFDRRDKLQARWARNAFDIELGAPTHWVPSTQAFMDLSLAGLAWTMNPELLAKPHIEARRLISLRPSCPLDVDLYWHVSRIDAALLFRLTETVKRTASAVLEQDIRDR